MRYLSYMQPLDKQSLFSIFEQGDEAIYKEAGAEEQLQNPFVLMGMVIRGLENYDIMDMMYMKRHPENYKRVRAITKFKYFNKLYGYLNRIDIDKLPKEIYKVSESFGREGSYVSLENMLRYFEKIEHYEKCAVVKKYQDLLMASIVEDEYTKVLNI